MIDKVINTIRKKSLKERFLLVIGILFFLVYLFLGLMVIFWKKLPINMSRSLRVAFGLLLIGYAIIRFLRLLQTSKEESE